MSTLFFWWGFILTAGPACLGQVIGSEMGVFKNQGSGGLNVTLYRCFCFRFCFKGAVLFLTMLSTPKTILRYILVVNWPGNHRGVMQLAL
jgi:hypothetical protein